MFMIGLKGMLAALTIVVLSTTGMMGTSVGSNDEADVVIEWDTIPLALNVYFEARGEPYVGQVAVALATMNRVHDDRWPDTVHGVVWQDNDLTKIGGEQFSWTALYGDEIEAWLATEDKEALEKALDVALEVLDNYGRAGYDFTLGANLYHALDAKPYWRHHPKVERTAIIGNHIFYRENR